MKYSQDYFCNGPFRLFIEALSTVSFGERCTFSLQASHPIITMSPWPQCGACCHPEAPWSTSIEEMFLRMTEEFEIKQNVSIALSVFHFQVSCCLQEFIC